MQKDSRLNRRKANGLQMYGERIAIRVLSFYEPWKDTILLCYFHRMYFIYMSSMENKMNMINEISVFICPLENDLDYLECCLGSYLI